MNMDEREQIKGKKGHFLCTICKITHLKLGITLLINKFVVNENHKITIV